MNMKKVKRFLKENMSIILTYAGVFAGSYIGWRMGYIKGINDYYHSERTHER